MRREDHAFRIVRCSVLIVIIECALSAGAAFSVAGGIRGKTVSFPQDVGPDQTLEIPLEQYWRGNLKLVNDRLTANKHDSPHVPNLIEYHLELPTDGRFE